MRRPVIGVMGAGEPSPGNLAAARELGRLVAERGWVLLTGGRPEGVMGAACAGAKEISGSLTLGILPGARDGEGRDVDVAVFTGMGEARNMINVLSSDAIVACGVEGPGTVSEVALGLKAEKPLILLGSSEPARLLFQGIRGRAPLFLADTPQQAVDLIENELGVRRRDWQD